MDSLTERSASRMLVMIANLNSGGAVQGLVSSLTSFGGITVVDSVSGVKNVSVPAFACDTASASALTARAHFFILDLPGF